MTKDKTTPGDSKMRILFTRFASAATKATGSPFAFISASLIVIIWAVSGPIFDFSETWQLVINTGTTIITFLMVFIIQQSQNRDTSAVHIKLNELIATNSMASNRLVCVEELSESELDLLKKFYRELSNLSGAHHDLYSTHSIDEAEQNHKVKIVKKNIKPKAHQKINERTDLVRKVSKPASKKSTPK